MKGHGMTLESNQEEIVQLNNLLDAVIDGSEKLLNNQSFEDKARALFDACKNQIGSQSGYIALLNEESGENELLFLDSGGLPCSVNPTLPMPIRGLREIAYMTSRPAFENNFGCSKWAEFLPPGHVTLKNVLFAPLVHGGKAVGVLGLANKPTDFDQKDVRTASTFGRLAAIALRDARQKDDLKKSRNSLRESENKFRTLFTTMAEGVCLHELIRNDHGTPFDYRIIDINPSYERITGISKNASIHMNASELYETGSPPFLDIYARVTETKRSESFEIYWPPMDKHFLISVFSPRSEQFATIFTDITDQKKKEIELQESEEYLSTTLNSIGDAVITTDIQGRVVRMNPVAEKLTGWELSKAKTRQLEKIFDIVNQKTRKKVENPAQKVMRRGTIVGLANHTVLISKDGREYFIDDSAAPIRDAKGDIAGVVLIFRDITEKHIAEQKIHNSEELHRTILQTTSAGFWIADPNGKLLETNESYCRMSGYCMEELLTMSISDLETLETEADVHHRIEKIKSCGHDRFESRHKRKDGSEFDVEVIVQYRLFGEGLFIVFLHDITERKRAEAERERLLFAINQAQEIVAITDASGEIAYVNPVFEAITGYSSSEAIGKNPRFLNSGIQDTAFYKNLWDTILSGTPWTGRIVNRRKDGALFTTECSISPIRDEDGEIVNFVWISRDISEIINLETRILQAQKIEAIGALASGIAHDFNNILFPITGLAELLMGDFSPNSHQYEHACEIYKSAMRASDLVKQILSFSRQTENKEAPVLVQSILKEILKLMRSTIPSNIEIRSTVDKNCGLVMADPTQMHQIAMNLITNAFHAVKETNGEITVTLNETKINKTNKTGLSLEPGRYALLSVSDSGYGIPAENIGKIFEPYFTTKKQGEGTGLGLSIVYGIVKAIGGDIQVSSEVDIGTTFNVYLPLMKKMPAFKPSEGAAHEAMGNESVLIVDDEPVIVRMVSQMLQRLGYKVTFRTSSTEALEAFRASPDSFDLVVTDMAMPRLTGIQLATEIVKIRPEIPIILCTGFSEKLTEEKVASLGIKGILMKPVGKWDIAQKIRKVLDGARNEAES